MTNKTLINKLAKLLDTTVVMLSVSTQTRWNNLNHKQHRKSIQILLSTIERTGQKRLTDMDYQNAMNQMEGR